MDYLIEYGDRFYDNEYEYRIVTLPNDIAKKVPKRLLSDGEWRALGIQMSKGWVNYHPIMDGKNLLFKRSYSGEGKTPRAILIEELK